MKLGLLAGIALCVVIEIQCHVIRKSRQIVHEEDDIGCTTPDKITGQCVPLKTCPPLLRFMMENLNRFTAEFLRKSTCGFEGLHPKVCCPPVDAGTSSSSISDKDEKKPASHEPDAEVETTSLKPVEVATGEPGTASSSELTMQGSSTTEPVQPEEIVSESFNGATATQAIVTQETTTETFHHEATGEPDHPQEISSEASDKGASTGAMASQETATEVSELGTTVQSQEVSEPGRTVQPHGISEPGFDSSCGRIVTGGCTWCVRLTILTSLDISTGIHSSRTCVGVLVSGRHIVTSASCSKGILISAQIGHEEISDQDTFTSLLDGIPVAKGFTHKSFDDKTSENDVAVLLLEEVARFNNHTHPVCLPEKSSLSSKNYFTFGWKESGKKLEPISLEVTQNPEDRIDESSNFLFATGLQGENSCQVTNGGPLLTKDESGLVQLAAIPAKGCENGSISQYMKVLKHVPWIKSKIAIV